YDRCLVRRILKHDGGEQLRVSAVSPDIVNVKLRAAISSGSYRRRALVVVSTVLLASITVVVVIIIIIVLAAVARCLGRAAERLSAEPIAVGQPRDRGGLAHTWLGPIAYTLREDGQQPGPLGIGHRRIRASARVHQLAFLRGVRERRACGDSWV